MSQHDGISVEQGLVTGSHTRTLQEISCFSKGCVLVGSKTIRLLTASSPPMSSWSALTDRACSMTKTHCDRSGGTFCKRTLVYDIVTRVVTECVTPTHPVSDGFQEALPVAEPLG